MNKERLLPFNNLNGNNDETSSFITICFNKFKQFWKNCCNFFKKALEMGINDPRKAIYAMKMGFALSIVSLSIFWMKPLPDVSKFSIWAILTVIVMFEFSIGATFIKGFNRGLGTFLAGMLAFLFAELSRFAGQSEKIVIVISFFIIGCSASYLRLYPTMAPYDYGFRVFVLTFCILMVAGNRNMDQYTVAILTRMLMFGVGSVICFVVNICIYPIWAGDDLHRLVATNFKELASSLEGCVNGYTRHVNYERTPSRFLSQASDDSAFLGYKAVIDSEAREKTLLGFAVWEPPHGRYRKLRYPWKTYVKVSSTVRHCAYTVMALHGCIQSEIQASSEKRHVFRREIERVSTEGAKVMRELGDKIEKMERVARVDRILIRVHEAGEELQTKIDQRSFLLVNSESWGIPRDDPSEKRHMNTNMGAKSMSETSVYVQLGPRLASKELSKKDLRKYVPWPSWISFAGDDLIKEDEVKTYESASALSLATFASLLIEFVARLQNVVDCFQELSEEAEFEDHDDDDKVVSVERVGFWTRVLK